jgi:hypothetical protein
MQPPVLAYPDFSDDANPLIITVDASDYEAGAVLTQVQKKSEWVLAYASTTFNIAETKYSTTNKELSGLRWSVKCFRHFIYGRKYIIRTDHKALIYLHNIKSVDARLLRTYEELNAGDYEIQYIPSKDNVVADPLSRMVEFPVSDSEVDPNYAVALDEEMLEIIPGGPNSLFQALVFGLYGSTAEHAAVREVCVQRILKKPSVYGLQDTREVRQEVQAMKYPGIMPGWYVAKAFNLEFNIRVRIHQDGIGIINIGESSNVDIVDIQCLGGVYFNYFYPQTSRKIHNVNCRDRISDFPTIKTPRKPSKILAMLDEDEEELSHDNLLRILIINKKNRLITSSAEDTATSENDSTTQLHLTVQELLRIQAMDTTIMIIRDGLLAEINTDEILNQLKTEHQQGYAPLLSQLLVRDGVLNRTVAGDHIPVVPARCLEQMITDFHVATGQLGRDKTKEAASAYFCNPSLAAVITHIIKCCPVCQRFKSRALGGAPLYKNTTKAPYEDYAIDLLELPPAKDNIKYLLVGIYPFTKFGNAVPISNKRSATVANALENRIFSSLVKLPETITSENSPEFRSDPFRSMLERQGVKHFKSIPNLQRRMVR